jgi:hypothetical protein
MITYILHFVNQLNQERNLLLQPIDAENNVFLEETYENSGIMRGLSTFGTNFEIPFTHVLRIEEYQVTGNWGGNGHKTRTMSGEAIASYTTNVGGDATKISQIKDNTGKVVYDKADK